ncbi:hypothetical protein ABIA32_003754 [Streptacidiphilus sp. MAP12-20]|uniref:hypothetical protein n=1 Tax=Streptacidiphilus sp. MAP12-20 TaxID=3156299 RepID=UPI0035181AE1
MSMNTMEWALVWLYVALMGIAGWLACRPSRSDRVRSRRVAAFMGLFCLAFLLDNMPRLLHRSPAVVLTLATVAFVPITVLLVMAFRLWIHHNRTRRAPGRH